MSLLRIARGGPLDPRAFPAQSLQLPEGADAAQLETALAKFCATYYESLVAAIERTATRVHLFTLTVDTYKVKLEAVHLLSHQDISRLASEFRTQLMGYLMPTFVDTDGLEDSQVMLATVLHADHVSALPPPPPPPPRRTRPAAARGAARRNMRHVAHWVSAHQEAYSQLRDSGQRKGGKKTKKGLKMKKIFVSTSYKRLEEEMDFPEEVTSGEASAPGAARSAKTSVSTEYLTPEESLSGSDTDQPPYSTTSIEAHIFTPETSASSGGGFSRAATELAGAYVEDSRAEAQAAHGAPGTSKDVQSPLEAKGSDESETTPAMAVTGELQVTPTPIGTGGEGNEPGPVAVVVGEEGAEPEDPGATEGAAALLGAGGQDAEAASEAVGGTAEGSEPAPESSEAGPSRSWVRAALSSVVGAMKAARPSVPASAPDSPAYSLAGPAGADATEGNGNASGDGDGTDGSAFSALKPPSVRRRAVTRLSPARDALEEVQRQQGLLRSLLLRHGNRLWLEVRGRPRLHAEPGDARLALLERLRRTLRDVELELRDAQRHVELRAECVASLGSEVWAGNPAPATPQAGGGAEVSVATDLAGGLQLQVQAPEPSPPPPPSPTDDPAEHSFSRILGLLCSCFTCLPRRQ